MSNNDVITDDQSIPAPPVLEAVIEETKSVDQADVKLESDEKVEKVVEVVEVVDEQQIQAPQQQTNDQSSIDLNKMIETIQDEYKEQLVSIQNIYELVMIVIQVVEQQCKQDKKTIAIQILSKLKMNDTLQSLIDVAISSGSIDLIIDSLVKVASNSEVHNLFTKNKQLISTSKSCCVLM
jgi:hypothetical protein